MNTVPDAGSVTLAKDAAAYEEIEHTPKEARYIRHGKAMTR